LRDAVGIEHIVVGSDYPFAIRQRRPGVFAKSALGGDAVLADNAFTFLGRDYDVRKLAPGGPDKPGEGQPRRQGDQARG
jgi:hypothetical protein